MDHILRTLLVTTCFFIGTSYAPLLLAQDDVNYEVLVVMKNGSQFRGKVKSETDDVVILVVQGVGEISLQRDEIKSMRSIRAGRDAGEVEEDPGVIPPDDYNSNRYLISPSGFGLKKGQSYYENIYLGFNSFSFGLTDRFTVTVGAELYTLLLGSETPILYISPRVNFPFDEANNTGGVSAGVIYFTLPTEEFSGIGVAQGAVTFGNKNSNITFGGGLGFSSESSIDGGAVTLSFSATHRLSQKLSFVTDNISITNTDFDAGTVLISAALRIHFNKKGAALNVGLFRPVDEDLGDLIAIPFFSATVPLR